jgi:NADH:ubiquinone oxidoreductase subunit B-like Fe-S oxidoreductase
MRYLTVSMEVVESTDNVMVLPVNVFIKICIPLPAIVMDESSQEIEV